MIAQDCYSFLSCVDAVVIVIASPKYLSFQCSFFLFRLDLSIFFLSMPLLYVVEVILQIFTKAIFPFSIFVDEAVGNNCRQLDFVHIFVVVYLVRTAAVLGKLSFYETFQYPPVFDVSYLPLFVEAVDQVCLSHPSKWPLIAVSSPAMT